MNQEKRPFSPPIEPAESDEYAPAVESLSDKWRDIQTRDNTNQPAQTGQRNSTLWGVGIGIALVIFLALVGGFLLLVWTVNR